MEIVSQEIDKIHKNSKKYAYLCILDQLFWFTKKIDVINTINEIYEKGYLGRCTQKRDFLLKLF